ncbi:MAG TPA: DUF4062 domain-containing protein [Alicycliphilus sp.]|nr:DUF4062 domain-containing protein [Alicycliphilus sp.]
MGLKIYVSSTFEDLKDYRRRVYDQLRALRHDVIAMEDYVAADERPLDKCLRDVRDSDVYIGLFAWRYGYVPRAGNPQRRSVTELEYLEAKKHKKPCLIFLTDNRAPWPPDQMDSTTGDNDSGKKIAALRKALREKGLVSTFETPEALATKVVTALYSWQSETSRAQSQLGHAAVEEVLAPGVQAAARKTNPLMWVPGSRLRVRFIGADSAFAARILRLAQIWSAYANIFFVASDDKDAEVRVAFDKDGGSWSYEGTNCLAVSQSEPTMNLGWLAPALPIDDVESVVLHEFGHVLGLAHEHNNPSGDIPWDRKEVLKLLGGPPNHWDHNTIDQYLYRTWETDRFPFAKPFDPLSIMSYFFPKEVTGGKQIFSTNTSLSSGDKEFISRLYPYATGGE